jgi:hypothetical protein
MGAAEGMVVSGLEQDWAHCIDSYDALLPIERGEVAKFLLGERRSLPRQLRQFVTDLSQTAFLEVGLRWSQRQLGDVSGT